MHLEHDHGLLWPCAECGTPCPLYDHQPERRWRHLDTCQFRTILHAVPPRSNCNEHGALAVKLPWAEPGSSFTALFEGIAIEWLKVASQKARRGSTWPQLGRSACHSGARRGPWLEAPQDRKHRKNWSGRKVVHQRPSLIYSGQRSGSGLCSACGRTPHRTESRRFLGHPFRGPAEPHPGRGDGHVGPLR